MVWKVLLVIAVILVIVLVALYYFGRKLEKRQAEGQAQLDADQAAQWVNMLIIDKKKLRMKESGLPQMVIDQTPWYLRRSKMPIVKAKIGPKIMTLVADGAVYDLLPVKKEVKVVVSGIYITAIKSARGGLEKPQPKKGFFKRLFNK